jgi:FKBP-type peptidyl-prolyl cis-trans isomerase
MGHPHFSLRFNYSITKLLNYQIHQILTPPVCSSSHGMGQYMSMQKSMTILMQLLAAGAMLLGNARAQTPATPSTPPSSSAQATPAQTTKPATTKKPATTARTATPLTLKTQKEKASYALGMNIGMGFKRQEVPVDPAIVARGLRDAMTGAKPLLTEQDAQAALTQLKTEVNTKMQAQQQAMQAKAHEEAAGNKKIGDEFLTANKAKDGVVTLPSGLQYKILKAGTGPKPAASDTVTCNYKGTLIDGTEFDSSYKRGEPAAFPVNGVIKGWTEALQLMPVGSKWQLFIPSDLAYGDPGRPGIAPGSTLIFEVELLSIGEPKK